MDPKYVTLLVLGIAIVALLREWLPHGLTGLLAPLALVLLGVIEPEKLYAGFASPAAIAVASMFVLSAALSRTGALAKLGHGLSHAVENGRRGTFAVLLIGICLLSAFVNNTTIVLVLLPVILAMCARLDHPPSRYLIPLSYAAIFGGTLTLVGTTTNILAAEVARSTSALVPEAKPLILGMWDFLPMGAVFVLAGVAYLELLGRKLLPDRTALSMTLGRGRVADYVTEVEIGQGSPWIQRSIGDWTDSFGVRAVQLIRSEDILPPSKSLMLEQGDLLIVKGKPEAIVEIRARMAKEADDAVTERDLEGNPIDTVRSVQVTLAEVILPPGSRWIGREFQEIGLRARYGVSLIAVQRHGHHLRKTLGQVLAEPGDMMLVQGTVAALRNLRASDNMILVEDVEESNPGRRAALTALGILIAFVGIVAFEWLDLTIAAILAACAMVLGRCLTAQQAFNAIEWNVVFLLIGFVVLGGAMADVGIAQDIAAFVGSNLQGAPLWLMVLIIYALTSGLTEVLSNNACAALMVPVVVKTAYVLGVDPYPLVMTVAFAASASFCTPFGYQTNLLVFAPGGYRFTDYVRVGLPLNLLFLLLATLCIPLIYG